MDSINVSDLVISDSVASGSLDGVIEMEEVFLNESDGLPGTIVQRSVDSEGDSLPFDIHYMTPESRRDPGAQQNIIGDVVQDESSDVPLQ